MPLSDTRILAEQQVTLPYLGIRLALYKVLHEKTGNSYQLALDSTGAQVDYAALQQEESALRYQKYGSMQIALHDLVARGGQGPMAVLIKLNVPEDDIDKETWTTHYDLCE
jgi:hypothetical protein